MCIRRSVTSVSMASCLALSISRSQDTLSAFFKRIRSRLDSPKATTGATFKIAYVFHRMLKHEQGYIELALEQYEQKYKERIGKSLQK